MSFSDDDWPNSDSDDELASAIAELAALSAEMGLEVGSDTGAEKILRNALLGNGSDVAAALNDLLATGALVPMSTSSTIVGSVFTGLVSAAKTALAYTVAPLTDAFAAPAPTRQAAHTSAPVAFPAPAATRQAATPTSASVAFAAPAATHQAATPTSAPVAPARWQTARGLEDPPVKRVSLARVALHSERLLSPAQIETLMAKLSSAR